MKKKVFFVSCVLFFALVLTLSAQPAGKVINPEAEALFNKGLESLDIRDWNSAIKYFSLTVTLEPDYYIEAYTLSGLARYAKGEYDGAIVDFNEAITHNSRDAGAYTWRGFAYAAVGNFPAAIADLSNAIHYDPTYAPAYNQRALSYLANKDYLSAIRDFEWLINSGSNDPNVYSGRAFAYLGRGNLSRENNDERAAIADFSKALSLMPKNANVYNGLGLAYFKLKDYDSAIKSFDAAIKLAPSYVNSYRGLARSYSARNDTGDYIEAVKYFTRAIELNPDDITAYNELINLYNARNDSEAKAKRVTEDRDKRLEKFGITPQNNVAGTVTQPQEIVTGVVQRFAENGILNQVFPSASSPSTSSTTVAPQTTSTPSVPVVQQSESPTASQDKGRIDADGLRRLGENIMLSNGFTTAAQ